MISVTFIKTSPNREQTKQVALISLATIRCICSSWRPATALSYPATFIICFSVAGIVSWLMR